MSDAGDLTNRRCSACEGGTAALQEPQAAALAARLNPAWERTAVQLHRTFRFPDFAGAFALATRIALLAESEGHHPDLLVRWGHLGVTLTTHSVGGLTDNDFIMAAKIDNFVHDG
jgi:4a-hydroxytetrahydrobiopterin dehydratase